MALITVVQMPEPDATSYVAFSFDAFEWSEDITPDPSSFGMSPEDILIAQETYDETY